MAKVKTFAVEVEVVTRMLVFVEARKAGGAEKLVQTEEGWTEASRYSYEEGLPRWWNPKTMRVVSVKEAGA